MVQKTVLGSISGKGELPTCTPYLMPFHIDHSGKAPISNFLRLEAAPEAVGRPTIQKSAPSGASADIAKIIEESSGPFKKEEFPADPETKDASTEPVPEDLAPSLAKRVTDATTRFISSFRGRTIQGWKMELPAGYGGLVLRVGDESGVKGRNSQGKAKAIVKSKGKGKAATTSKGRVTRSAARVNVDEEDGRNASPMDVDDDGTDGLELLLDEAPLRMLTPSSQFSSFVLWHPDNPVDEGRDEYARALTEWTRLANEVRSVCRFTISA